MQKETMIFISGKITAIITILESIRGRYVTHPDFDKNLNEAFYALNRATSALESSEEKIKLQPIATEEK